MPLGNKKHTSTIAVINAGALKQRVIIICRNTLIISKEDYKSDTVWVKTFPLKAEMEKHLRFGISTITNGAPLEEIIRVVENKVNEPVWL